MRATDNGAKTAVYTGSFDPPTLGHINIIERASRLFGKLVVGVGTNVDKTPLFSPAERTALVIQVTSHLDNVEVREFSELAVTFVRQVGADIMVRGIRPLTDLAGEFTMMLANRELDPDIETVFLMADQQFVHVSSSLLKQITPLATDEMLSRFVSHGIIQPLRNRLAENGIGPSGPR